MFKTFYLDQRSPPITDDYRRLQRSPAFTQSSSGIFLRVSRFMGLSGRHTHTHTHTHTLTHNSSHPRPDTTGGPGRVSGICECLGVCAFECVCKNVYVKCISVCMRLCVSVCMSVCVCAGV